LLSSEGLLGFIVPSYWVSRSQTEALRQHLLTSVSPRHFLVLPEDVFGGVKMDSCIIVAGRQRSDSIDVAELDKSQLRAQPSASLLAALAQTVQRRAWDALPRARFNPRIAGREASLIQKVERASVPLSELVEFTQGLTLYRRSSLAARFGAKRAEEIVTRRLFHSDRRVDDTYKKELLGSDVQPYIVSWNGSSWVSYGPWLAHAVDERFFRGPRLLVQKIRNPALARRLVVGLIDDDEAYPAGVLLNGIPRAGHESAIWPVMALLNSRLLNFWYRCSILDVSIRVVDLKSVPVRMPESSDMLQEVISKSQRLATMARHLKDGVTSHEHDLLTREHAALIAGIDDLVYDLYGLSEAEVGLVEEVVPPA
jgi:hypothetical protein